MHATNKQVHDDVQAYLHCLATSATNAVRAMSLALGALGAWMSSNRLRFNPSKIQFIWLGTRQQLAKLDMAALAAAYPDLAFSSVVRDLRATLDQELTFASHINRLTRNCFYQLRQLRTVPRSLTPSATSILIHSFITARLDYCCSLYAGLPAGRLGCLDRVFHSAARLIGRIPKFAHVSSFMRDVLHWLPIEQRIEYRIAALVWRCSLGIAPSYLSELPCPVLSARGSRSLRSSQHGLLLVPFAHTYQAASCLLSCGPFDLE